MGPVFRLLCGLFAVTLFGAACGGGANIKPPASTVVTIGIDTATGNVVTVQGEPLKPYAKDQPLADTSKSAVTITTGVTPVDPATVNSLATATSQPAPTGTYCTVIIINGRPYCR